MLTNRFAIFIPCERQPRRGVAVLAAAATRSRPGAGRNNGVPASSPVQVQETRQPAARW